MVTVGDTLDGFGPAKTADSFFCPAFVMLRDPGGGGKSGREEETAGALLETNFACEAIAQGEQVMEVIERWWFIGLKHRFAPRWAPNCFGQKIKIGDPQDNVTKSVK